MKKEINQFCDELITKYQNETIEREIDLIENIRNEIPDIFFIPFLQYFQEYLFSKKLVINSKYFLKILISNYEKIEDKDYIRYGSGDIKIDDEKFLIKGLILEIIIKNDLRNTLNYITYKSKAYVIPEMQSNLLDVVNKNELIVKVYEDFEQIKGNIITSIK